jgi:hypothetical protein
MIVAIYHEEPYAHVMPIATVLWNIRALLSTGHHIAQIYLPSSRDQPVHGQSKAQQDTLFANSDALLGSIPDSSDDVESQVRLEGRLPSDLITCPDVGPPNKTSVDEHLPMRPSQREGPPVRSTLGDSTGYDYTTNLDDDRIVHDVAYKEDAVELEDRKMLQIAFALSLFTINLVGTVSTHIHHELTSE